MKRVIIFRNGTDVDGKVIPVTHSLENLLSTAGKKFNIVAQRLFTGEGGEIDEIDLIRDNDVLYVSTGEPFIRQNTERIVVKHFSHPSDGLLEKDVIREGDWVTIIKQPEEKTEAKDSSPFIREDEWVTIIKQPEEKTLVKHSSRHSSPCIRAGSEWVTLNVGGEYFLTSRSTLVMKEPNSVLAKMFSADNGGFQPSEQDANGAYLIDRSANYFRAILNYLRTNEVIIDSGVNPYGVLEEARYFGIESMIPQLEEIAVYSHYNEDTIPLTRRDVIIALITTKENSKLRFQGVNLAGADLSRLDLQHINFKYANLRKCRLVGTNLSYCSMKRADLSQAILDNAQLRGVKMLCANLEGASLKSCNFEDPTGTNANLEAVNLKGANLEESNMANVILRVATLRNANLKHCELRQAVLAGADLENCDLTGSNLQEANLRGANLKGASLELMQTPVHMSQTVAN